MSHLQKLNLNGKIKSIRIDSRFFKKPLSKGISSSSANYFNESGILTQIDYVSYGSHFATSTQQFFDENERLIKILRFYNNIITEIDILTYHPEGNLALREISGTNNVFPSKKEELSKRLINKYDLNNNLIESIRFLDGLVSSRSVFTYDINRNILEEIEYDMDDKIRSKESYTYDGNGNIVEKCSTCHYDYFLRISKDLKTYDDRGRVIESNIFSKMGTDEEVLKKDWLLESTHKYTYPFEVEISESTWFQYNENDELENKSTSIKETKINIQPVPVTERKEDIRFKYEYDDRNNWIKKTEFYKNYLREIQHREIKYYE